uniref:Uncharacterized protein n=1 Tax=uncultured prokaryote TaxID=198431 RepID=A0A0H5Q6R7_9ZZZZ|nr:hypothetical protein [uncultured prokaryote]
MARISAQVILRTKDNIPANYCSNTFFFDIDELSITGQDRQAQTDHIEDAIVQLYAELAPTLAGLSGTGHRIKFVDIDDPRPQYPYHEALFSIGLTPNVKSLPQEVCIASSFEADQDAGTNQATRRGRVFLGPINEEALNGSDGRITDEFQGYVEAAFDNFADAQDTAGDSGWRWCVYSRTLDHMAQVTSGHVDNAFDIQRRRGVSSTLRKTWAL